MKIVNENLEMVDYDKENEKKEHIIKDTLPIKLGLIDLVYTMNSDASHKMTFIMIAVQLLSLFVSVILQIIFYEFKAIIAIVGMIISVLLMCLVVINTEISSIALKKANEHRKLISDCIDTLVSDSEESNESPK